MQYIYFCLEMREGLKKVSTPGWFHHAFIYLFSFLLMSFHKGVSWEGRRKNKHTSKTQ